jgi:hypothetical protein
MPQINKKINPQMDYEFIIAVHELLERLAMSECNESNGELTVPRVKLLVDYLIGLDERLEALGVIELDGSFIYVSGEGEQNV